MAEAFLFGLSSLVLHKLTSLVLNLKLKALGVPNEVEELRRVVSIINAELRRVVSIINAELLDAEEKQLTNYWNKHWVRKLEVALYEADHLLDDFTEKLASEEVMLFCQFLAELVLNPNMDRKVKVIRKKLDAIVCKYYFETHYFVHLEHVVGREQDKRTIIELLLEESNIYDSVSVIPIVGIGGLGKTTLAKLVYNDELVNEHFEIKMWVCVSNVFDEDLILQYIVDSTTNKKCEILSKVQVEFEFKRIINGKKYLLVLDDVVMEDDSKWQNLKAVVRGGARGSKILVTTRTLVVANIIGTISPHLLKGLSQPNSWFLFKQWAFMRGVDPEDPTLVEMGEEIVKKCVGIPLPIAIAGSLLYSVDSTREWLYFKDNELSKIALKNEYFRMYFQKLKVSYDRLPQDLKQCFAYCSIFPKYQRIDKQTLVQLWIAQDFIKPSDANQLLEDVGVKNFMDLINRSFFQDVWKDLEENVISCNMHDHIHDLAKWITESNTYYMDSDVIGDDIVGICHVSVSTSKDSAWEIQSFSESNKLQTFVLATQERRWGLAKELEDRVFSNENVRKFFSARALDLHGLGIQSVPHSISELKDLRYLDLSDNCFESLPNFICFFQNLQTLKLNGCKSLKELPKDTQKLVSLRHLEIEGCSLNHMPHGLGKLTSLQTLSRFVVGRKDRSSRKRSAGLSELEGLVNLRGELSIERLRGSISKERRKNGPNHYYLGRLTSLKLLRLVWDTDEVDAVSDDESLLEGLRPPPNLMKLSIHGYGGMGFPRWKTVGNGLALPNVVEIELSGCCRCRHLTMFGLFPHLQVLRLSVMESLEYIYEEDCVTGGDYEDVPSSSSSPQGLFPSLKRLDLYYLEQLKGLGRRRVAGASSPAGGAAAAAAEFLPASSFGAMQHLAKLEELHISSCLQLDMQIQGIGSLTSLSITAMPNLESLPSWLQSVTTLQSLKIGHCRNLRTLPGWIGTLGLLQKLQIEYWESLTSLPEEMRRLIKLKELIVVECSPVLYDILDTCLDREEEDWLKISRIQHITLGDYSRCQPQSTEVQETHISA